LNQKEAVDQNAFLK